MNQRKGITKIELLFVVLTISIVMAITVSGTESARAIIESRAECLNNLKSLALAWAMYADDNNQMICSTHVGSSTFGAPSWCGRTWEGSGVQMPEEEQIEAIKDGALWPYVNNIDAYSCPAGSSGFKGELVTYDGMDGMNGSGGGLGFNVDANDVIITRNDEGLVTSVTVQGEKGIWAINRNDLKTPSQRLVFLDMGFAPNSSYTVNYAIEQWWDPASIQHDNGTTYAFADGHAEYYQWQGDVAVELGKKGLEAILKRYYPMFTDKPQTAEDAADLQWIQKGCWGKLGYKPSF